MKANLWIKLDHLVEEVEVPEDPVQLVITREIEGEEVRFFLCRSRTEPWAYSTSYDPYRLSAKRV